MDGSVGIPVESVRYTFQKLACLIQIKLWESALPWSSRVSHIDVLIYSSTGVWGDCSQRIGDIHDCSQCYSSKYNSSSYQILVLELSSEYGLSDNTNRRTLSGINHSKS